MECATILLARALITRCGLFDLRDVYLMVFIATVPGNLFDLGDNSTYRIRVMRSFNTRKSMGENRDFLKSST